MNSLKDEIKNPYQAGKEAAINGKSIHYDPYRNMNSSYWKEQEQWHNGYNSVSK